jgi:hypothetical protein
VKKVVWLIVMAIALTSFSSQQSLASSIAGSKCTKAGITKTVSAKKYTCVIVGKRLVWNKGVAVKASQTKQASFPITIGQDLKGWHWDDRASKWISNQPVPKCKFPIVPAGALADFSKATIVNYPGKVRGGSYKPHGGVIWNIFPEPYVENVVVRAPFDGTVIGAWDGIDESGIYQFGLNFVSDCGVMVRMMHLYEAGPKMKLILKAINANGRKQVGETYTVAKLKKGDVIATNVGTPYGAPYVVGAGFDLGILDLRQRNKNKPFGLAEQTIGFGGGSIYYAEFGVCWFEGSWLSEQDKAILNKLPVIQGTQSDYCGKQ